MNVLSLFDGMSCTQIALERAGIAVDKYYASEIDKYAIKITQKNYPDTIQLGDITKWRDWKLPKIDLIIGGSPCQGFSIAGKRLNFEDPRSKLFFVFVDILKYYNPKWFILENVKMKKEWSDIITEYIGVNPIEINSSLVSAQNRKRLYWTNIPIKSLPEDKGIMLRDIIENGIVDRKKSYCIDANYFKGSNQNIYFRKRRRQIVFVKTIPNGYVEEKIKMRNKYPSLCSQSPESKYLVSCIQKENKSFPINKLKWRKLTPLECERLQTVPEGYTKGVSNTQRYKMLGNGFTVDVIVYLLKGILND